MTPLDNETIKAAQKSLSETDPVMKGLIERSAPFALKQEGLRSPFEALARAIAAQQLHGNAAKAILGRFIDLVPGKSFPEPDDIMNLSDEQIRAVGFSYGKVRTLRDLTDKVRQGIVPSAAEIGTLDDDAIIERITKVHGIGRWSVEMLLISHLRRPDVLPVDDFGVRKGFMRAYGLPEMPKPKVLLSHGEKWRPFRTIASWYLWRAASE